MPSVNPPADAEQARRQPAFAVGDEHAVILVGDHRECDTQPEPCAYRYVHLASGGRQYAGYLWET